MATDIVKEVTTPKRALRAVLYGMAVVFLYGLLAPMIGSFSMLAMAIPVIGFTVAEAIAAGIAAILVQYAFEKAYPKV